MTTVVKLFASGSSEFATELKQRVDAHFAERGLSDKATPGMVAKSVILLAVTFGSYGLILSGRYSPWTMLALAVVMGVGMAGVGFCVPHDALHINYVGRPHSRATLRVEDAVLLADGLLEVA